MLLDLPFRYLSSPLTFYSADTLPPPPRWLESQNKHVFQFAHNLRAIYLAGQTKFPLVDSTPLMYIERACNKWDFLDVVCELRKLMAVV